MNTWQPADEVIFLIAFITFVCALLCFAGWANEKYEEWRNKR